MKILYVTNWQSIAKASGGYINDYLNDTIFYGLYELQQEGIIEEVVDSTPIISLYKSYQEQIPTQNLWGGMTTFWLIENDNTNRNNIEEKIKNKYFDYIIYGAIRRCQDYYDLVKQYYPDNKIICIDGNDESDIDTNFCTKHLYFKRELIWVHPLLKPISFSIPTSKLYNGEVSKIQLWGTVIPGKSETYIFKNEDDYYKDYQKSFYGVTTKKAGWDCMRHYEILANKCIPYFPDLDKCHELTLFNFPKNYLIDISKNISDINLDEYNKHLDYLINYTKNNLTTRNVAKYLIDEIKKHNN